MRIRLALTVAVVAFAATLGVVPRGVPATEAAGPGTWSPAQDLQTQRAGHTSTLLANGKVLVTGGLSPAILQTGAVYNPTTNGWTYPLSVMQVRRAYHAAVLLRDGRVLVTGGAGAAPPDDLAADFYVPSTNEFVPAPALAIARSKHTSTLLPDGRVLVVGGETPAARTSAEIFDPITNSWSMAAPPLNEHRWHAAQLLGNGLVLVAGSFANATTNAELYDPATNSWTPTGSMGTGHARGMSTMLADGRVLVVGGLFSLGGVTAAAEIYDPTTEVWTPAGSMDPRMDGVAVLLGNGKVLAGLGETNGAGGSFSESALFLYDPQNNSWTPTGLSSTNRVDAAISLVPDGRVFLSGGFYSLSPDYPTMSTEMYDPTAWVPVASPPPSNSLYSPGLLWSGNALFFDENEPQQYDPVADAWASTANGFVPSSSTVGGVVLNTGNALSIDGTNTQVYNRVSGTWSDGPDLLGPDAAHIFVRLNDGRVLITSPDGTSELYNPTTNTIVPAGTFSIDNFTALVTLVDGRVLAPGGLIGGLDSNDQALLFDPATGLWSTTDEMATARTGAAAVRLADGRVLVSGGDSWHLSGPPLVAQTVADAEIYSPISNTWTTVPSMLHARINHSLTLLPDGRVLATGGCQQQPPPSMICTPVTEAEAFNPSTNTWASAGEMHASRGNAGTVRLTSGDVLVAGGGNASAERYDLGIHTDTDGDGYNDGLELALNQHPWLNCKTMRADVSGDGLVNVADLGKVAAQSGKRPPPSRIDQNGDKIINVADLGLTASQSGKSVLMCA